MEILNQVLSFVDITSITLGVTLKTILAALGLSLLTVLTFIFTHRKTGFPASMIVTILLMSPIVSMIVVVIGSNLARAISIGGGLALIRYRNTIEDPRDLVYLFLSLAIGMACGTGFIGYAAVVVVLLLFVLIFINLIKFDTFGGNVMRLSVVIPESLDYYGVFDPVMNEYCRYFHLDKVKTTDYGTLAELVYRVKLKDVAKQKAFIDAIRERNGNLNVTLVRRASDTY